jgi:hypothetical protein
VRDLRISWVREIIGNGLRVPRVRRFDGLGEMRGTRAELAVGGGSRRSERRSWWVLEEVEKKDRGGRTRRSLLDPSPPIYPCMHP